MKKLLMIAFLIIGNAVGLAQESVILKYNYKKGDKYTMQMTFQQNMGIAGETKMMLTADMNVNETSKESFILANKIKRVVADMTQGGKSVNYDSSKKESELDAEGKKLKTQFASVLKATSYTTFDKSGKILKVTVEPNILGANANQSLMTYSVFPKEAVKVGSTWANDHDIQGMKLKMVYKVTKITSKSVEASISGNVNLMGISGKITGTVTFDRKTGNTDYMKMDTSVSMQGMTMSMGTIATIKKVN